MYTHKDMCSWVSYIVIELCRQRQHAHTIHSNLKCGEDFQSSV